MSAKVTKDYDDEPDISFYARKQYLCTCDPPRTGANYTNCITEHNEHCAYVVALAFETARTPHQYKHPR